jgi:uncharacterized RDD family membrane protein YckC
VSNDPKKPLDPTPAETPDILQRDLHLDRRNRQVPSFEELKKQAPGPANRAAAMTEPGIPGPFARPGAPQAQPQQPRAATPTQPGSIQPGAPGRPPNPFELAATAQTPRHVDAVPRPVVTAQPAPMPPQHQPTRAPIAQAPPGLQPRAHAAPTQPHAPHTPAAPRAPATPSQGALPPQARTPAAPAQGAPPQARAPAAPSQGAPPAQARAPMPLPLGGAPAPAPAPAPKLAGPTVPLHPNPRARQAPTEPARPPVPAAVAQQRPPDATRPGVAPPRQAPPSPVDWASRSAPVPDAGDAPTMPVPVAPKLTAAKPMEGATVPSGHNTPVSYAPAHVPVAAPRAGAGPVTDEVPTAPNRPVVQRPAAPKPSFSELPQQMPSHLMMTQPGIPGPYAGKKDTPVAATRGAEAPPPPAGPTRVLEQHGAAPAPVAAPDFGEVPAFEPEPAGPAESVEEAEEGDVVAAPAALWRRLFAWTFDLSVIAVVVGGFFAAALAVIGKPSPSLLVSVALPALGVVGFVAFVYTTLFAFLWRGRTPGRRLLGIHLVDASGHAPKAGRALLRAALSLASFALFLSGFWLALFDRRGQTLHDKLTSTFVVRLKPAV